MSIANKVINTVKVHFISGVLVVVPLILTYIVLRFLFETVDNILQPLLLQIFGYSIYGMGVLTTVLLIILAGILTRNFIGARLYHVGERVLVRMPLIRPIYSAAKQLLEALTVPTMKSFKEVVLVEYPRTGIFALGFVSNRIQCDVGGSARPYVSVFIPSTPTPISGMVVVVPENEAHVIDMTVEDGIKFLVSGGVASPDLIKRSGRLTGENDKEVPSETR